MLGTFHFTCSSGPSPLVSPQVPPLQSILHGLCSSSCVSQLHLSIRQRYLATWYSGPLISCCRGIRHHATKESWEVNSPCSEPLINGRQCLVDKFFSLSPPRGTFLRDRFFVWPLKRQSRRISYLAIFMQVTHHYFIMIN